jgi:hypothetical protein
MSAHYHRLHGPLLQLLAQEARGSRPLMVILLQMLAGGWGAWRRSGRHYIGVEVVFHPYTLLNNQLFVGMEYVS